MSAITLFENREIGPDGLGRYRTRIRLWVHSHQSDEVVDLSPSVINFSTNKTLKSVGTMNVALTADYNFLNIVFPNDHINLYVDRGDKQGWTRVFYGFVDNIEEESQVQASGIPRTIYTLQCSDFQKAFEKTQIYFNPHVAARADFNGGFVGTPNIGGLGLMTRGVRINGSPSDLVTNMVLLLMGFGSQFLLPYNPRLADRVRQQRAEFILNRLSSDARDAVMNAGGYAAFLENERTRSGIDTPVSELTDPDSVSADESARLARARFSNEVITTLGGTGSSVGRESSRGSRERGVEAYNVLNTTLPGYPPSLLDVMDIFTFIERTAIDGYMKGAPVWEHQGSVLSFLTSLSNEVVNELFFDLRPISRDGGLALGTDWSREEDSASGNTGTASTANGIQYEPSIIMREYPFSTIGFLDASDISLSVRTSTATSTGAAAPTEVLGRLYFGAIFSNEPNTPGRHVIHGPDINPDDVAAGMTTARSTKHLDVAVVNNSEIVTTKFARSDSDHYNLFEFYSDAILGSDARFFMQDLLPIITPIHIVRHGLRVRSLTTRFGRFSLDVITRTVEHPTEEAAAESANTGPVEPPAEPSLAVHPIEFAYSDSDPTRLTRGFVSEANTWHYRDRPSSYRTVGTGPTRHREYWVNFNDHEYIFGTEERTEHIWRFHNGVDIVCPEGTPVRAVRDGWIVAACSPQPLREDGSVRGRDVFGGYGGITIIYHDQDSPTAEDGVTANGAIFSLYAHLSQVNFAPTSSSRNRNTYVSQEINERGRFTKVRVRAGDVIGLSGSTGSVNHGMGPHLHFEIIRKLAGRVYPSMDRAVTPDFLSNNGQLTTNGGWAPSSAVVSATRPTNPSEEATRSQDPIRFCREHWDLILPIGSRLPEEFSEADLDAVDSTTGLDEEIAVYLGDANEENTEDPAPPSPTPTEPETTTNTDTYVPGCVDTPSTRRQIARWALLNDHWYQHNLEYIAGTIQMRGAPEIRVGYRLDLLDRALSFYVEGVAHNWSYGAAMQTTLHVTRGQPNNPYPSYVLPYINGFDPTETQRQTGSRLASYFIVPDPSSVRRSLKLERANVETAGVFTSTAATRGSAEMNTVDMPTGDNSSLVERYNEQIIPAEPISVNIRLEEAITIVAGTDAGGSSTAIETNPMGGTPRQITFDDPIITITGDAGGE